MSIPWLQRTALLLDTTQMQQLAQSHVLVVGLGGVGSYAAEALTRAGVGSLTLVDGDVVDVTNINRQLPATHSSIGHSKALLMQNRLQDINPAIKLTIIEKFLETEEIAVLLNIKYDYIIDAIDSLTPKLCLLQQAIAQNQKIVSSMGAGGKMNPAKIQVSDISKTHACTLAQQVRKTLRKQGIQQGILVVFSSELSARNSLLHTDGTHFKKSAFGTIAYMPAMFGLTCASVVIQHITHWQEVLPHQNARK